MSPLRADRHESSHSAGLDVQEFHRRFGEFLQADACGPVVEMLDYLLNSPGKYTRPRVLFELAQVLGVDTSRIMPWAFACEALHTASLVHDDIQDGDQVRRGRASIWRRFGQNEAINLGDYLLLKAPNAVLQSDLEPDIKVQLASRLSQAACTMVTGQSAEFRLNSLRDHDRVAEDYELCARGKTGALFASLAGGVAIVGKWKDEHRVQLEAVYESLGLLLQMQDDVLDLYGDKKRQEIGCDLKEGKVSLLIVSALQNSPQMFDQLKKLLQTPRENTGAEEINKMRKLWYEDGSLDIALDKIMKLSAELCSSPLKNEYQKFGSMLERMNQVILKPIAHLQVADRLTVDALPTALMV